MPSIYDTNSFSKLVSLFRPVVTCPADPSCQKVPHDVISATVRQEWGTKAQSTVPGTYRLPGTAMALTVLQEASAREKQ